MKKVKILRIIILLLIAADMAVIFSFSAQKAEKSDQTSSGVIESIVEILHNDFDSWSENEKQQKIQSYQRLVRKLAHMTEYASLGVLSCAFALTFGFKASNLIFSFLFCLLYSVSDEVHQLFVLGRSCQMTDVLIDSAGALVGIAVFAALTLLILTMLRKKRRRRTYVTGD